MKVHIRNMVCDRCKQVIKNILDDLALPVISVQLGELDFGDYFLNEDELARFKAVIEPLGLELINDKKSKLIEKIRKQVITFVQMDQYEKVKLSDHLKNTLHHDYSYLSNLFSVVEGVTIERYFILQRIEKAKELLIYDELTLTEISHRLGFSSVAHLSGQFTKVTGLTPTIFKKIRENGRRLSIDKV